MQDDAGQRHEIEQYCRSNNLNPDRWVRESVSGTVAWEKRNLGRCLRKMKNGDLLVCTEISRLGRNMLMVMSILNYCSAKGIVIHTIKDNFDLSDNLNSKIIAFAFSLAAEIERNLISQRTKEALAVKKIQGVRLGRPPGTSGKYQLFCREYENICRRLQSGESLSSVANSLKLHRNTLKKYLDTRK